MSQTKTTTRPVATKTTSDTLVTRTSSRASERVRSGGVKLAVKRAGGDSAAGSRTSVISGTGARYSLNRTRPSTTGIFVNRQIGPHHGKNVNIRLRIDHPRPQLLPVVVHKPKVVIHKDITITHPVPICPPTVVFDNTYYDDDYYYNDDYYDDGYYADAVYSYNDTDDGYWSGGGGYYEKDWEVDPRYDTGAVYTADAGGYDTPDPWYDDGVGYPIVPGYTGSIYVDSSTPSWYAYSDQYYGWPRLYRRLWFGWISPYRYYRMSYYWDQVSNYWWDTYWPKFWSTHFTLGLRF